MRGTRSLQIVIPLLLAGCVANTPAAELTLDAVRECAPSTIKTKMYRLNPDGSFGFAWDPGAPETPRFFKDCIRPYFAAHALQGIAKPGTDAPTVQRQGYEDLDQCLQRGVLVGEIGGGGGSHFFVRPPVIHITALNEDGTFRWEGDDAAGRRLTVCMRQKSADVQQQASGAPAPPWAAGNPDGTYAGDVCLGPRPSGEPARCFRAQATLRDGKVVSEWRGREGVTVKLAGEVSTLGEVRIEWHSEHADGSQFARAILSGTIRDGRLDASGAFSNGRSVSIRRTLNVPGSDSSEKESDGREHAHPSGLKRK
jgi:hypothetical protein